MADQLYNTLQLPILGVGVTSAAIPHKLHLGGQTLIPNLVAAPGCSVNPADVTPTTIKVTNTSMVPFAPQVLVWYVHDIARVLGINGTVQPPINPFIITNGGGGGGIGLLEHVNASSPTGVVEALISDWNGAVGTDNTLALQTAFAYLTAAKRAMYAPGQYALGDGAGGNTPEVLPDQDVFVWGDGDNDQTLVAWTKTGVQGIYVHGDGIGGFLRLEDMSMFGYASAGPALFNMILMDPSPPGNAHVELRHINFNGRTRFNTAVIMNGPGHVLAEDCSVGPNMTRPFRGEEFGGASGTWIVSRCTFDTYDFCIDFGTKDTVDVDDCTFLASRDIGAGSEGVNSSNAPPGGASVPDHYRISRSRFYEAVVNQLVKEGPFLAEYSRNTHLLGPAGIGMRCGSPTIITASICTTPSVPQYQNTLGVPYVLGQMNYNDGGKWYVVTTAGLSGGGGGPTGVGAVIPDPGSPDGLVWAFVKLGVVALSGVSFSADPADVAGAGIDSFISAGDSSIVTCADSAFSGVCLANVVRGADAGTVPWRFKDNTFENYADVAGRYNIIQRGGELVFDGDLFRRSPFAGGNTAAIFVTSGVLRLTDVQFLDVAVLALDAQGTAGNVTLYLNGCFGLAGFLIEPLGGVHTITVYGGENDVPTMTIGAGNPAFLRSYMKPLTARGPDLLTTTLPGQLQAARENEYLVTDGDTVNNIFTRGIIAGPYGFRSGGGYVLTQAANAQGNGLATNFGFIKPGTDGVATPVGQTRWFIQDAVDKLWYEQG